MTNLSEVPKKDEKRDVLMAGITAAIEYAERFEFQKRPRLNAFLLGYLKRHGDAELSAALEKLLSRFD